MALQLVTLPEPPPETTHYALDRKGGSGWEPVHMPSTGGRPTRWVPLPLRLESIQSFWGGGEYRAHWRTASKRALGVSVPFEVPLLNETPPPVQTPQRPPQGPANGQQAAELAGLLQLLGPVLQQQPAQTPQPQGYPEPCSDPLTMMERIERTATARHDLLIRQYQENQAAGLRMHEVHAEAMERMNERTVALVMDLNNKHQEHLARVEARANEALEAQRAKLDEQADEMGEELDELRKELDKRNASGPQLQASHWDRILALAEQLAPQVGPELVKKLLGPNAGRVAQAAAGALPRSPGAADGDTVGE